MKFLKININYIEMVDDFFTKHPNAHSLEYDELCTKYFDEFYWPSNFLENNLSKLYNWDCNSLIFTLEENKRNNIFFEKWCDKYDIKNIYEDRFDNLLLQIIFYQPDIIYFHEIWFYSKEFFEKLRFVKPDIIILGWDCAPGTFSRKFNLKYIDMIFTCAKIKENSFKEIGINSKSMGHFFDFEILDKLSSSSKKKYDVVFAGTIDSVNHRVEFLKQLIENGINLKIFSKTDDPFLKKYCSKPVYGKDYYNLLKNSKIIINSHAVKDIRFSGNIRMYEATGLGCLLITDYKEDLNDKFEINKEIVSYKNIDEIYQKVDYYLKNSDELEDIAKKGQERTKKEYSYESFAKEIFDFVNNFKKNQQKVANNKLLNLLKHKQKFVHNNTINKNLEISKYLNSILSFIEDLNNNDIKLAIYGNGNIYNIFKKYFKNIVVVCDQKIDKNKTSKKLCHPTKLHNYNFDYILILVLGREEEIFSYLVNDLKIASEKILFIENNEKFNSSKYWEKRYAGGGNSGAGSYNNLAKFKANVINDFIKTNSIKNILEFGCGDGNNLALYDIEKYIGIDVSSKAIEICKTKFSNDQSKSFFTLNEFTKIDKAYKTAKLVLSLDVIYHLVEDNIFNDYMNNLFESSSKFIIIYSSNHNEILTSHVKHRNFTNWIEKYKKDWRLKEYIKNIYPFDAKKPNDTSFADFYIYERDSQ